MAAPPDDFGAIARELRDAFNAYHHGEGVDVAGILARRWHAEGELVSRWAGLGRTYRGRDGIAEFLDESRQVFASLDSTFDLQRVAGEGEHRVVIYQVRARTRDTGMEVAQRFAAKVELRDGLVYRFVVHGDPDEALREAGLE